VERSFAAREALNNYLGLFVNKNAHNFCV